MQIAITPRWVWSHSARETLYRQFGQKMANDRSTLVLILAHRVGILLLHFHRPGKARGYPPLPRCATSEG